MTESPTGATIVACDHCGEPIAPYRRSDARYCDASCRSAARRARTALRAPARGLDQKGTSSVEAGQRRASEPTGRDVTRGPRPSARWLAEYRATHGATGSMS
jgi:hypothetical protein